MPPITREPGRFGNLLTKLVNHPRSPCNKRVLTMLHHVTKLLRSKNVRSINVARY